MVPGYQKDYHLNKNESIRYYFNNSIQFGLSTNASLNGTIEYDKQISNRETFIKISNNNPLVLNFSSETDLGGFGYQRKPKGPSSGNSQYQYQYNYILQIRANSTVQNLTIQYLKVQKFGLDPNKNYKIAQFYEGSDSWEILQTEEKFNESTNESYLETQLLNIKSETDYYITLFQVNPITYEWIWIVVIIGIIGIVGLFITLSKKDYIQFLKTRTVPIDKGAHQLTMKDVLENENRSMLIDLILADPGIHFNELLREADLSAGNLAWHLDILETYKVIGKKRVGRYLVYFPYYQKNPISNIDLKLQKSELTLKILEMIEENPGTYNNEIAKILNVDHKTVSYHINKLKDLELIKSDKSGRKKKLYPNLEAEYFINNEDEKF
ncbi:MAG: winged helix-turn-helix transcriptional regulator [Candidatus Lokiarchaeota archaeon]|nr:winged helix-turn-helix transcriptional regulator [Candidatus Lokiarchaeota archaeon]